MGDLQPMMLDSSMPIGLFRNTALEVKGRGLDLTPFGRLLLHLSIT